MQLVLNQQQLEQKIKRLGHEIIENLYPISEVYIGGISGNGDWIANELGLVIQQNSSIKTHVFTIELDKENPLSSPITSSLAIADLSKATLVLVDDVINSGLTMQYAVMHLLNQSIYSLKTVALVDRLHRRYPIKCDFVGLSLSTTLKNRVELFQENEKWGAYLI